MFKSNCTFKANARRKDVYDNWNARKPIALSNAVAAKYFKYASSLPTPITTFRKYDSYEGYNIERHYKGGSLLLPKPMAAFVCIEIMVKTTLAKDDEIIQIEIKSKSKKLVGLSRLSDTSRNILNKRKPALSINVATTAYGLKPSNRNFTLSILRSADVADTAAVVVVGSTMCNLVLQHLYLLSFS